MKHLKLYEDFLNEGSIPVYPPGNPFKREGSIEWVGVEFNINKWIENKETDFGAMIAICYFDYNKYSMPGEKGKEYRSVFNDENPELPEFLSENPKYNESEFDIIGIEKNEKNPKEPWIKLLDKDKLEFWIPPHRILEIQKGASVVDEIYSGYKYLIDKKKGMVDTYRKVDRKTFLEQTLEKYKDILDPKMASPEEMEDFAEKKLQKKFANIGEFEDMPENPDDVGVIVIKFVGATNFDRKLFTLAEWKKEKFQAFEKRLLIYGRADVI